MRPLVVRPKTVLGSAVARRTTNVATSLPKYGTPIVGGQVVLEEWSVGKAVFSWGCAPVGAGDLGFVVERDGTAVLRKDLPLDTGSRFAFHHKPTAPGTYSVRISFAGGADHAAGGVAGVAGYLSPGPRKRSAFRACRVQIIQDGTFSHPVAWPPEIPIQTWSSMLAFGG